MASGYRFYKNFDGQYMCGACLQRGVDGQLGRPAAHEHEAAGGADRLGYANCASCGLRFRVLVGQPRLGTDVIELAPAGV